MRRFPAVLLVALSLAACGGTQAAAPSPAPASSGGAAKPATAAAAPASASVKPAASAPGASAASGEPIKIGFVTDLTGPTANEGKDNLDAFTLYLDSIDNTVSGRKIQVITADAAGQPDAALTKTKELVENQKVDFLAGFNFSTECFAVAPYAGQAKVPMVIVDNCAAISLGLDPKFASPYLVRLTSSSSNGSGVAISNWIYQQGARKAIMLSIDNAGIQENADSYAKPFVEAGGSFVQELHPPITTTDFGPIVSQFDPSADSVIVFEPSIAGLRFGQAFSAYGSKIKVYDVLGGPTNGPNLAGLKDKAAGFIGQQSWTPAFDTPMTQAWSKAWNAKHPDRQWQSVDTANGYAGAQAIVDAIKRLNGNVSDKTKLVDALFATDTETVKGPFKVDRTRNVAIQNSYLFQVDTSGDPAKSKLLQTIAGSSVTLPSVDELTKFPYGKMKGKWVGMTKAGLANVSV
ncbi:MAG TPA: ABC transporter substrate-binding protein [Chloroflexota bacterium]|nr:ABC transporter substrate-binding protein [Chloroflexota bacterium]